MYTECEVLWLNLAGLVNMSKGAAELCKVESGQADELHRMGRGALLTLAFIGHLCLGLEWIIMSLSPLCAHVCLIH